MWSLAVHHGNQEHQEQWETANSKFSRLCSVPQQLGLTWQSNIAFIPGSRLSSCVLSLILTDVCESQTSEHHKALSFMHICGAVSSRLHSFYQETKDRVIFQQGVCFGKKAVSNFSPDKSVAIRLLVFCCLVKPRNITSVLIYAYFALLLPLIASLFHTFGAVNWSLVKTESQSSVFKPVVERLKACT